MIISGPRLRLRPVALSDMLLFAACYGDWPADAAGYYSLSRAQNDCDIAVRDGRAFTYPLTADSAWQQSLAIYTDDPRSGIGIHRAKAEGTVVTVLNQAFIPEARGLGYFDELQTILQRYAFEVLGATEARFDIIASSTAALSHVQNRAKYKVEGDALGQKGAALKVGKIIKTDRDAWIAANASERNAQWSFTP